MSDDYLKTATAAEVNAFAVHSVLSSASAAVFEVGASSTVRREIAFILRSGILDKRPVTAIVATAGTFKVTVQTTPDGKIVLPESPSELRKLLRFLDEDYYESPLIQTWYDSNSKRIAD